MFVESLPRPCFNRMASVICFFDETMEAPQFIRLHFVREEVLAR